MSVATKLVAVGLSAEHAQKLINELGITDEGDFEHIEATDLVQLGVKPIKVRRILAEFQVTSSATAAAAVVSELRVKLDTGPRPVAEMHDSEELLDVLVGDRPQVDKELAEEQLFCEGLNHVVIGKDGKIHKEATLAFWKYGTGRETHWSREELPVVSIHDLFRSTEKVEIDPYVFATQYLYVTLVEGFNSDSGVDWSKVSMERRALILAAGEERRMLLHMDASQVALLLEEGQELRGGWDVLNRRLPEDRRKYYVGQLMLERDTSKRRQPQHGQRRGRQSQRQAPEATVPNRSQEFQQFLLRAFDSSGIRRLDWSIKDQLPGLSVSNSTMATEFVNVVERAGSVKTVAFWRNIMSENRGRANEARQVAALYGVKV